MLKHKLGEVGSESIALSQHSTYFSLQYSLQEIIKIGRLNKL